MILKLFLNLRILKFFFYINLLVCFSFAFRVIVLFSHFCFNCKCFAELSFTFFKIFYILFHLNTQLDK